MRRRPVPPVAAAVVALIAAGCSNAPAGNESANGRTTAEKFAACMRDNGVSEFPDPDASGRLTIDGVVNGSSLDTSSAAWKNAIRACKDLQPAGFTGEKRSPEKQRAALRFARCIRENGVKDFPDPAVGEPMVDTRRIPSSSTPGGMSILNAAMRKCRDLGAAAMGDR